MPDLEKIYQCQNAECGYLYDPDKGDKRRKIPAGTSFDDLPDNWHCPSCGGGKKCFKPLAGKGSTLDRDMKASAALKQKC